MWQVNKLARQETLAQTNFVAVIIEEPQEVCLTITIAIGPLSAPKRYDGIKIYVKNLVLSCSINIYNYIYTTTIRNVSTLNGLDQALTLLHEMLWFLTGLKYIQTYRYTN